MTNTHKLTFPILLTVAIATIDLFLIYHAFVLYRVYVDVTAYSGMGTSTSYLNQNEELTLTNTHFEQPATTTETVRIYKQHCTVVRDDDLVTDYECY